jgi:ubiquinone/menaquinone biosynthesis C-methylase UbiE
MKSVMQRVPERELMDGVEEARTYAGAKFPDVVGDVVDRLLQLAPQTDRPLRLIDMGTGPGSIPILIARARPNWQITALDASKAMLRIAGIAFKMTGLHERVKTHLGDAKATGLPPASFDVVFCNNFLHHMPDPVPLWREMKRLIAPGGLIYVRDLIRPDTEAQAREVVRQYASDKPESFQEGYYVSLLSAFRVEEVREQLAAAGVTGLNIEQVSHRNLDIFGNLATSG